MTANVEERDIFDVPIGVFDSFNTYKHWVLDVMGLAGEVSEDELKVGWELSFKDNLDDVLIAPVIELREHIDLMKKHKLGNFHQVRQFMEEQGVGEQYNSGVGAMIVLLALSGGEEAVTDAIIDATLKYKRLKMMEEGVWEKYLDEKREEIRKVLYGI